MKITFFIIISTYVEEREEEEEKKKEKLTFFTNLNINEKINMNMMADDLVIVYLK